MNQMTERLVVGGGALVVGLLIGWTVHGLTGYDTAQESATTYDNWRVVCPAPKNAALHCHMEQDSIETKTGQQISSVSIGTDKDKPVVLITVPLGVALPAGVDVSFGGDKATKVPYRTCTAAGCIAEINLDAKLQANFDGAKDGKAVFVFPTADAKPVTVPISLKGFNVAQRAYRNAEAKRGSWFWRMW